MGVLPHHFHTPMRLEELLVENCSLASASATFLRGLVFKLGLEGLHLALELGRPLLDSAVDEPPEGGAVNWALPFQRRS